MQLNGLFTYVVVAILVVVFSLLLLLKAKGIWDVFRYVSELFDLRKRRKHIEELEAVDKVRKENLKQLHSLIRFRISDLSHNLKIPAPSVDLQFMVYNDSVFDVELRKFIYKPQLLGIRGTLSESTHDHEIHIPHQSYKWFNTRFMIQEGIAKHLENLKRQSNGGKHGKLTWHFSCTAYVLGPEEELRLKPRLDYSKEWYEIELPLDRHT